MDFFYQATRRLILRFLGRLRNLAISSESVVEAQARLAWADAQSFIYANAVTGTRLFEDIGEMRDWVLAEAPTEGLLLEFGVYKGRSISRFAMRLRELGDHRPIIGFDSFRGLGEEWIGPLGDYSERFDLEGSLPAVPPGVELVPGWIEETLPVFWRENSGPVAFVHIDTDTYGPAKVVLETLREHCSSGTVVLFDELLRYPSWRSNEFRALNEVFRAEEYDFIAFGSGGAGHAFVKAAIRIR